MLKIDVRPLSYLPVLDMRMLPRHVQTFYRELVNNQLMRFDRKSPLTACFQCLNCYKTYKAKGPSKEEQDVAEQKALDCCGSFIQGFYVNYRRWGIQKWYGR